MASALCSSEYQSLLREAYADRADECMHDLGMCKTRFFVFLIMFADSCEKDP